MGRSGMHIRITAKPAFNVGHSTGAYSSDTLEAFVCMLRQELAIETPPNVFDKVFRQIEVWDDDGRCLLSIPQWCVNDSFGFTTGEESPITSKLLQWYSPNMAALMRALRFIRDTDAFRVALDNVVPTFSVKSLPKWSVLHGSRGGDPSAPMTATLPLIEPCEDIDEFLARKGSSGKGRSKWKKSKSIADQMGLNWLRVAKASEEYLDLNRDFFKSKNWQTEDAGGRWDILFDCRFNPLSVMPRRDVAYWEIRDGDGNLWGTDTWVRVTARPDYRPGQPDATLFWTRIGHAYSTQEEQPEYLTRIFGWGAAAALHESGLNAGMGLSMAPERPEDDCSGHYKRAWSTRTDVQCVTLQSRQPYTSIEAAY